MGRRGQRRRARKRGGALAAAALAVAAMSVALYVVVGHAGAGDVGHGAPVAAAGTSAAVSAAPQVAAAKPSATRPSATPATKKATPTPRPSSRPKPKPSHSKAAPPPATGSSLPAQSGTRVFTFVNKVSQTIWLASGEQTAQPALKTTGWVLRPGQTLSVRVPDHWNGRFWGRTGCTFDASGHGRCQTGDCGGAFQCPGYGVIPATLAEFNLNAWDGLDFYDVSLVDGSNLPMYINLVGGTTKDPISSGGCSAAGCTHNVDCPAALQVKAAGQQVGCESPCGIFNTDQYCCRGKWAPREDCLPARWPVDYAAIFKKAEPFAYSYVDDDATSTFTSEGEAGYRITFGVSP